MWWILITCLGVIALMLSTVVVQRYTRMPKNYRSPTYTRYKRRNLL